MDVFYTGSQRFPSRSKIQRPLRLAASSGYMPSQLCQPKMYPDTINVLELGCVCGGGFILAYMTWVLQPKHPCTTSWKMANQPIRAVKFNVALEQKRFIVNLNFYKWRKVEVLVTCSYCYRVPKWKKNNGCEAHASKTLLNSDTEEEPGLFMFWSNSGICFQLAFPTSSSILQWQHEAEHKTLWWDRRQMPREVKHYFWRIN